MAVQAGEEMMDILSEGEPDMSHMDYDLEYSVRVGKTEYVRLVCNGLWNCSDSSDGLVYSFQGHIHVHVRVHVHDIIVSIH